MSAAIFLSIPQSSVLAKVDSRLTNSVDQPKGQGEQGKIHFQVGDELN